MVDLKTWLREQGLTVRDFALELGVPVKTVQDWVYRGVEPSAENRDILADYVTSRCAHHWIIAVPNGPMSDGVCQRCGDHREFQNSISDYRWPANTPAGNGAAAKAGSPRTALPTARREG
ncbi:MAG: helix-turn-helix transcriptional regulator [Chloroflexi bacterium]|nr:helix-turn-helix transcriptional regulator [Chloroflexota bacterium]